jgi:prepilin-type N-terminal cleavage/methylation domain-containing protein
MIQNNKHKKINTRGFSVIELVVGVSVFSIVVATSLGLFGTVLRSQRAAFAIQELQNNTRFVLEFMSKELRTGRDFSLNSSTEITFTNADDIDIVYRLNGTTIQRSNNGGISFMSVSSDDVDIIGLRFNIFQSQIPPKRQPFITIVMEVEGAGPKAEEKLQLIIQTSVSQRHIILTN